MKTLKFGVLKDMIKQLEKYSFTAVEDIEEWDSYTGKYHGENGYTVDEGSQKKMHLGETWIGTYDCALWLSAKVEITEQFANRPICLEFDVGGEALVTINGKIAGAVSNSVTCEDRNRIFLDKANAGDILNIEIEAALNAGNFTNAAMAGAKYAECVFKKAQLIALDEVCEGYFISTRLIYEALEKRYTNKGSAEYIKDEYICARVYEALDDSLHMVDFNFEDSRVRKTISEAADYLEKKIKAIPHLPQSEVIFTSHSHIDIAWLWRIQETIRKGARTFSNNMALMDRYPNMTFAQSQAILYDMMKKNYPEIYERIKEKVKNGQWDIVGNVWVEADTNIASGEALIRQLLYGREYFKKEFGVVSDTYWLPDCFGFSWALPQIISRSGMKYFLTTKLLYQDTNRFPHTLFRWRSPNGAEVLAYLQRASYNGNYSLNDIVSADRENDQKDVVNTTMAMFGYGDGGGGATYRMLEQGKRLENFPGLPKTRIGHVDDFFDKINEDREKLPVWNDEMYYENHRGTYTSQAFVKKNNRKGEYLFSRAEMAGVFAQTVSDYKYNKEKMEDGWKILLKNQFHDILPGTSIHPVFEDCRVDYKLMNEVGNELKESAVSALNSKIKVDSDSVIVWNFLARAVTAPVTVETENTAVMDGEKLLACNSYKNDGKTVLSFIAENVPPMGYKVFKFANQAGEKEIVTATKTLLENSKLKFTFDNNGIISSIYDKQNDREVLNGRGNLLAIFQDKCIHETAWNLEINYNKKGWELVDADSIEVVESSALKGVIRITRSFNKSKITQDIILYKDADHVDFDTTVDWHESDKVLKAAFDVDIINTEATYEMAHGAIKRPTHWNTSYDIAKFEACAHKWADLSEGGYGVSILNDCKYGYDIKDSRMRITLMRAPTCPDTTGDHGINTFVYSLYPHKNSWQDAETVQRAFELNIPLQAYCVKAQNGNMPGEYSFVSVDSDNVIVDAIKPAQDGNGIILRVYEAEQRRGKVKIKVMLPFESVNECNLMETDEQDIKSNNGEFEFSIKPFEVKTFRLK